MELTIRRLAAAGAVAGFLGFGGMSLAGAQETTTTTSDDGTTTTEDNVADEPATDDPTDDPTGAADADGCDHDGADASADGTAAT